jgi:hypothetical protein
VTVVREAFGVEPKVLVVQFPADDIGAVFPHWLKLWGAKGLICKGDGERVAWRTDGIDGRVDGDGCLVCAGPKECGLSLERGKKDNKTGKVTPACGPQGSLRFALDVLPGIYSLEIGSWRNCRRVLSWLNALAGSVGGLRGYPVRVELHPEQDESPDGRRVTVQVLDIVPGVATGVAREMWRAAVRESGEVGVRSLESGGRGGTTEHTEDTEGEGQGEATTKAQRAQRGQDEGAACGGEEKTGAGAAGTEAELLLAGMTAGQVNAVFETGFALSDPMYAVAGLRGALLAATIEGALKGMRAMQAAGDAAKG